MLAYEAGSRSPTNRSRRGSFLVAMIATTTGFRVAARDWHLRRRVAGGAVIGVGIGLMHFTGMLRAHRSRQLAVGHGLVIASLASALDWRRAQ